MAAYATYKELEARWRTLETEEQTRADQKLLDASLIIDAECRQAGIVIDVKDETTAATLSLIACEMVKRAMVAPVDQAAVSQQGITVGEFSGSLTFANPSGDLYLTKAEKRRLGIGNQRASFIHPWEVSGDV